MGNPELSQQRKFLHALLCFMLVPMTGLATDIYTPSLPSIMQYFNVSAVQAKYSITIYILSIGIFQPLVGPLADSLGRRWLILFGTASVVIMMWFATITTSIHGLWAVRFLQGLAISLALVPARALLKDLYHGDEFKKQISTLTVIWALGPLVAPYIGGYLQAYWGWKANFYALSTYAFIALLFAVTMLKETIPAKQPLRMGKMLASYALILKNRSFLKNSLLQSFTYCQIVIYGVTGSFLIQAGMHYSAIVFGRSALFVGLGWLIGNIIHRFTPRVKEKRKILLCSITGLMISCVMVILAALGQFNLNSLVLPVFVLALCGSIMYPITFANAIAIFPKHAATASAVNVGIVMILVSIFTSISSSFHAYTLYPISITFFIFWCITLAMYPTMHKDS
ncbi:MAG: Bcr/CflA family efflux MFS transporter [Coxiellaceae bacterium]|nr:Bcr/CflA family efflux MFS transporter [Coxiellaceae bacterium]